MHIIAKSYKSLIHIIANAQAARRVFELDGSFTPDITEAYPSKIMGSISTEYEIDDINVVFPVDVGGDSTLGIMVESDVMRVLSIIRANNEIITTIDVPKMEPYGLCLVKEFNKDFINERSLRIEHLANFGDHINSNNTIDNTLLTIFYDHYDIVACADGEIIDTLQELISKSRALANVTKINHTDYNVKHIRSYHYPLYDTLLNNHAPYSGPMNKSCMSVHPIDRSDDFNFSKMKCFYCQSLIHKVFLKFLTYQNEIRYKCISCNNKCGTATLQYSKHVGECPPSLNPWLYELAYTNALDLDAFMNSEYYGRREPPRYFATKNAILIYTNTLANLLVVPPRLLDGTREVFLNAY